MYGVILHWLVGYYMVGELFVFCVVTVVCDSLELPQCLQSS
jgi:hypothetical protein